MRVLISCECRATKVGEAVFVCGSVPELGEWDCTRAVRMWTNQKLYPTWVASVRVRQRPETTCIEFKFGVAAESGVQDKAAFRWEKGGAAANRTLALPPPGGPQRVVAVRSAFETPAVHEAAPPPETRPLRLGSYNVRYAAEGDAHKWPQRLPSVVAVVRALRLDVVGFQEVLKPMLDDLIRALPEFAPFSFGRDDGGDVGEACPVFIRADRLSFLHTRKAWLSEAPERPGKGWDASLPRIASVAQVYDHLTGRIFSFTSTHLDHRGPAARTEGARLAARLALAAGVPACVVGDFNAGPGSPCYKAMLEAGFSDAREASASFAEGPDVSFVGFPGDASGYREMIDFVFCSDETRVNSFLVAEKAALEQTVPPSDHFAVAAEIEVA